MDIIVVIIASLFICALLWLVSLCKGSDVRAFADLPGASSVFWSVFSFRRYSIKRVLLVFYISILFPSIGAELEKSGLDIKKISRSVSYYLPAYHLKRLPMDSHISTNAFNLFIDSLDPTHSYFLQSDIRELRKEAKYLHKQLRKGDISFAHGVYRILMERMTNRVAFVEKQLETGFDIDVKEEFSWKRRDALWPENETEWNDLWRKRLKNEYIAQLVNTQVYSAASETNSIPIYTNTTEAVTETTAANVSIADAEGGSETVEPLNINPEESILDRYKQLKLTMESFDEEMLLQRYLTSFAQVYDPHSDYLSPVNVEDFNINMKLSLVGIGAMLRPDDGMAEIVRLIPGGPAETDGRLKAGDRIVAVAQDEEESVSIMHWPLYKAVRLIRGEKGTTVVLTVIPGSDRSGTHVRKIDLVRDEVKLEEQAAKSEVRELSLDGAGIRRLGVITLPDFYADLDADEKKQTQVRRASNDVRLLLNELIDEGIEGLILDLRNNGGGLLSEAIETAGLFISSGPIVQMKQRKGVAVLPDADPAVEYGGPMIVLVNRLSASASEILAAALQDYKRAVIVGDAQTHGKGTVQTLIPLGSLKGSLKLTTASYYRINGGSTQLKGVTPDIIIPSYLDVMEVGEDSLEHALPWDTIHPAMYRIIHNGLEELVPLLTEQSRDRLAADKEFQVYLNKREHLKERYESKTLSLSLASRLAEAETEKELDDMQSGFFFEREKEEDSNDLILNETLHILSNLIDLEKSNQDEVSTLNFSSRKGSPAK